MIPLSVMMDVEHEDDATLSRISDQAERLRQILSEVEALFR